MEYYMTLCNVAAWAAAAAMLCVSIVFRKPQPCPQPVPDDAASIGGGYMLVWASDRRVHVRFRNNGVTVLFDRRAAKEFGEWLASVQEVKH